MANKFLIIPNDHERQRTVEWLGAHGITYYLRSREVDATLAGAKFGGSVTILVPEDQLDVAKRVLSAMPKLADLEPDTA